MKEKEKIDFIAEEEEKIEKTKDEIINEIIARDLDLPSPDELVKRYEALMTEQKAEDIIIELQDGSEYSYSRLPSPKCQIVKAFIAKK